MSSFPTPLFVYLSFEFFKVFEVFQHQQMTN